MLRSTGCGTIRVQPALKPWPRHHAVLEAEQGDQPDVDGRRHRQGRRRAAAIDRDRHPGKVADEGDEIEEGRKEDEIRNNAEHKVDRARHGRPLPS